MKIRLLFCLLLFSNICLDTIGQESKRNFKIHTVAFYNLENLFDTINDINKNDEASPIMEIKFKRSKIYKWFQKICETKEFNITQNHEIKQIISNKYSNKI